MRVPAGFSLLFGHVRILDCCDATTTTTTSTTRGLADAASTTHLRLAMKARACVRATVINGRVAFIIGVPFATTTQHVCGAVAPSAAAAAAAADWLVGSHSRRHARVHHVGKLFDCLHTQTHTHTPVMVARANRVFRRSPASVRARCSQRDNGSRSGGTELRHLYTHSRIG